MRLILTVVAAMLMVTSMAQADDNDNPVGRTVVSSRTTGANFSLTDQDSANPQLGSVVEPSPLVVSNETAVPGQGYFNPTRRQRTSILGRLVELERRKNAWLRSRFQ